MAARTDATEHHLTHVLLGPVAINYDFGFDVRINPPNEMSRGLHLGTLQLRVFPQVTLRSDVGEVDFIEVDQ
jgi:hypothetical protein